MEHEPCLQNGKRSSITKISGPDGLEAWLVALAAMFINFIMAGLARMSGILYVEFIDIFHTDRRQASLPFSIRSSIRNLLGPVVGILGQKYGVRPVIVAGGVIGIFSAASCFYVNDIVWMTIIWGVINGIGTSLTTTLPQVVISQHFKKYRSTASGIAFSGGCIGSFFFPALMEYLLHTYAIGGTFLIIAGIMMNVIPAAMILKTPSWWSAEKKPEIQVTTISNDVDQVTVANTIHQENEKNDEYGVKNLPQKDVNGFAELNGKLNMITGHAEQNVTKNPIFEKEVDTEFLYENSDLVLKLLTNNFTLQHKQSDEENSHFPTDVPLFIEIELFLKRLVKNQPICDNSASSVFTPSSHSNDQIDVSEKDQLKNGCIINGGVKSSMINFELSLTSLEFYLEKLLERSKDDILKNVSEEDRDASINILEELGCLQNLLLEYKKETLGVSVPNKSEFLGASSACIENNGERSNTFFSHIRTAVKLHAKPLFILICLCRSVHFLTLMPVVTTIVDFSMDKGLPEEDGKYVIAALSFGDLVGRLGFGWITDRGYVSLPRYMLFVMIIQGASTVAVSFMQSRAAIMVSIAVFGLLQGSVFVRHPVLVSRYLESHEQSIAMGCINFFSGFIGFILPLYIGYFRDTIGSYDGMFYINGSIGAFVGFLWLFEPYFLKMSSESQPSGNDPADV